VLLFADGPTITVKDLPENIRQSAGQPTTGGAPGTAGQAGGGEAAPGETGLKDIVKMKSAELEKDLIAKALEETGGNVTRAAKLLQISRKSLQTKMKEFGLRDEGEED
jgi:DNA-binding NtrC family response regulator